MPNAHIIGTGSAVPQRILTNKDLEQIVDTSDEWITRRTGIKERHIATSGQKESTIDLGTQSAYIAMERAGVGPDQIDTIIVGTVTSERRFPSTGCMIQKELGAHNAAAYDVSAGCSGFIYGLELANNAIRVETAEMVLVIGTERLSSIVNWQDRTTCVLLGDGAGAIVLCSKNSAGGILSTHIKSDGQYWDLLYTDEGNDFLPAILKDTRQHPFHMKMEGNRLFKQAVSSMVAIAEQALQRNRLKREDVQLLIPHQANLRILQAVAEKLQIPMDKVFTNVHKYGNTSSASIPLALDEALSEGRIATGDNVLLLSFGAGLTWGAALLHWTL